MGTFDWSVIAFVMAIYLAAVVSPGPNFAVVSRLAVQGKHAAAGGVVAGVAVTSTLYAVLAMTGLAVVLGQIGWLARGIQIAGGVYLVYLGVMAWRTSGGQAADQNPEASLGLRQRDVLSGFRLGSVVSLSNPKTIAFFTCLYAAAVPFDATLATKASILAGGFSIEVLWYSLVLFCLSTDRVRSIYHRWLTWIERSIGTILAYFGIRLIFDRA